MDSWQVLMTGVAILGTGIAGAAMARLPRTEIRLPVYAFVFAGICWAVGDLIASGATDALTKRIGVSILYTGSIMSPPLWWIIALRWAEDAGAALPLRSAAWQWLPLVWAGAMWLAMISDPLHGAFLTPVVGGRNVYQPLWFAMALPNYAMVLSAFAVEVTVARRIARRSVRRQAAFLIAASLVSLSGNWLYVTDVVVTDATVAVLSISIALLLLGMAREGLFGVMPAALSAIASQHPEGILVADRDGHLAYANARARELLSPVPLDAGRTVIAMLRDPALQPETSLPAEPGHEDEWWRALSGPTGLLFQVPGRRARWVQIVATSLTGRGSEAPGWLLHLSDVTTRRQAELHEAQNRRLESVAALALTVSRDFQGAFSVVRGNAEFLERELQNDTGQRHLARIFEAASLGADLAHELQVYAGTAHSLRSTHELSQAVAEACTLLEADLPPRVQIHQRSSGRLLPIEADPIQLRDCLFNLLTNAVEASEARGGPIEVQSGAERIDPAQLSSLVWGREQPAGEYAYIEIRDEGGGMEPEVEERAFEPFFSTRHKDRGSGLSAVLGIARAHDALVGLENSMEWGCTFTLYFPLASES